jgi:superoxide reductase
MRDMEAESMTELKRMARFADWSPESHLPTIDAPASVRKGQVFELKVTIGKRKPHASDADHHISWAAVHFHPDGNGLQYVIGKSEFTVQARPEKRSRPTARLMHRSINVRFSTGRPGIIHASGLCSVHGHWLSSKKLEVR